MKTGGKWAGVKVLGRGCADVERKWRWMNQVRRNNTLWHGSNKNLPAASCMLYTLRKWQWCYLPRAIFISCAKIADTRIFSTSRKRKETILLTFFFQDLGMLKCLHNHQSGYILLLCSYMWSVYRLFQLSSSLRLNREGFVDWLFQLWNPWFLTDWILSLH